MSYAKWLPAQAPPPLAGPNGSALLRRLGEMFDEQRDRLIQGVLARFPAQGSVDPNGIYGPPPSDAQDAMGEDRGLPRATTESADNGGAHDLAYGVRLQAAWDTWDYAGSHYGLLRALQIAGYTAMVIVQDNGRYAQLTGGAGTVADLSLGTLMTCVDRPGATAGWMFDALKGVFYSQFGIVFTADAANLQSIAGQKILVDIVNEWKPAKANFVAAWVIIAGGSVLGWPTGRTLGTGTLGGDWTRVIPGDGSPAYELS